MTRLLPFVFSQSDARKGPYFVWNTSHKSHLFKIASHSLQSKMLISPSFNFIFKILKKIVITVFAQSNINFKF